MADQRDPVTYRSGANKLPLGNRLLSGQSWNGQLDFDDPASMARFNAYVGRPSRTQIGDVDLNGSLGDLLAGRGQPMQLKAAGPDLLPPAEQQPALPSGPDALLRWIQEGGA